MKRDKKKPVFAPGDDDMLKQSATKKEKKEGDFTMVTALSFDEVDPS